MFTRVRGPNTDSFGRALEEGHLLQPQAEHDHDAEDKSGRRKSSRPYLPLQYARYPSSRVRGIYGLVILILFYTAIFPSLITLANPTSLVVYGVVPVQLHDTTWMPLKLARRDGRNKASKDVIETERLAPGEHKIVDGRLIVDPNSKIHPIHQLIRDARSEWDNKVSRQSKTLKEAVNEYRRRYRRQPPAGFEKWWAYVVKNNVQLPDEYDMINRDLALFWALSPSDIRRRNAKASRFTDTFTLNIVDGEYECTEHYKPASIHDNRKNEQLSLLKDIVHHLPDMTVVYSVHDTPRNVISWEHRQDLMMHIDDGDYLSENDQVEGTYHGWDAVCPYASALKKRGQKFMGIAPSSVEHKSFIVSHTANMDVCQNPELIPLHGLLAGKDHYVKELNTVFSLSKTTLHTDILGVPTERIVSDVPLVPWKDKFRNRILWRGATTALHYNHRVEWQNTHRVRLIGLANNQTGETTVLAPPGLMDDHTVGETVATTDNGVLNEHYMDLAFVGKPIQCHVEDGTCKEMEKYAFRERVQNKDLDQAKYLFDIDGNGWSARFQRLLISGSLVFKSTAMPEWWNDRIQPWYHYVPIKLDFTDVYDSLAYFAGDAEGRGGADDQAQTIARAGREWSKTFYRKEDMVAYVFRLYLEWGRLQQHTRSAHAFHYDPSMEVPPVWSPNDAAEDDDE